MKRYPLCIAFFFAMCSAHEAYTENLSDSAEMQRMAIADGNYKKAIDIQLTFIQKAAEADKALYTKELALLYLKDQDQEHAFAAFLTALDLLAASINDEAKIQEDEQLSYQKALAIYFNPQYASPQEMAQELLQMLLPVLQDCPDHRLLEYFLAIAYANLGKYAEFFRHFWSAYQHYPHHYLAYKTKAILYVKILERTREDAQRIIQRQRVIDNLTLALQREPLDASIYRLLVTFSPQEKKQSQVRLCLNKILDDNIIIPRTELMFYVTMAVKFEESDLAQRFIFRAREWYPKSRMIMAAQQYLDAHK